jgi:DNA-binding Xre family transcriptional regulator
VFHMGTNERRRGALLLAVASELRAETARRRMSKHVLAERSGVPYATVQKSLTGNRMIDVEELAKICRALDVSPSVLL